MPALRIEIRKYQDNRMRLRPKGYTERQDRMNYKT